MAMSALMTWEVRTGGSDTANSGGFRGGASIGAPTAPTVAASSGGSVAVGNYYCVVTYSDGIGDTVISGETAVTTTVSNKTITVTSPAATTGALTWNAYFATATGGPYFPQGTGLTIGSNRVITTTPPTTGTQPRGVDRTLSNSPFLTIDNSTVTATTAGANSNTLTFTGGYTPTGADVGNIFHSTGGTNINSGFFEISGITSTTWTVTGSGNLTTAGGAGSSITGNMGGALASIGQAAAAVAAGNTVYCQAGTYAIGNGTVNTAGNKISPTLSGFQLIGYTSNRNVFNTDTPPVFTASANSQSMLSSGNNEQAFYNLKLTNPTTFTSVTGLIFSGGGTGRASRIYTTDIATGINLNAGGSMVSDSFVSNGGIVCGGTNTYLFRSAVDSAPADGISISGATYISDCIVSNPVGRGIRITVRSTVVNCTVYNSSSVNGGIEVAADDTLVQSCVVWGVTGTGGNGIKFVAGIPKSIVSRCAVGSSNANNYDPNLAAYQQVSNVTLTANPFVNAGSLNFALNNTAGGGLACKAAGLPGTWLGISTTGYRDIGAVQTTDLSITPTRARAFTGM